MLASVSLRRRIPTMYTPWIAGGLLLLATSSPPDSLAQIQKDASQLMRSGKVELESAVDLLNRCFNLASEDPEKELEALQAAGNYAQRFAHLGPKVTELRDEAIEKLIDGYLDDERLGSYFFGTFRYPSPGDFEKILAWSQTIETDSKLAANQAAALTARAFVMFEAAGSDEKKQAAAKAL